MARIGVVLSGCGVLDGSEIHESVLALLAIDRLGHEAVCMAPDTPQTSVMNHLTGQPAPGEIRNVLVESARIARGKIRSVDDVRADDVDALLFPGGFGAAKNLCDFAMKGPQCEALPSVARLIREIHAAGKPIAAICIAPALIARVLGDEAPQLTIGTDKDTAAGLEAMGAEHVSCPVHEFTVDRDRKIVSSPAYMLARGLSDLETGITNTVGALVDLIES